MTTSTFEKLPFGKYRGSTIEEIYQSDPGYLRWMAKEDICYRGIFYGKRAAKYLKQQEAGNKEEQPKTVYKCAECGKQSNYAIFRECPFCADPLCGSCLKLHTEMHNKAREQARSNAGQQSESRYEHRREYGRQASQEEMDELFARIFGQQQTRSNGNGTYTHTFTPPGSRISVDVQNAFKALGLPPAATVQEVKRAFRKKAKEAHPDTGGSEQAFKALNAAYQLALAHAERNK